jgi:hypothetical protein
MLDSDLDESIALACGIMPNTTEFVDTWMAPNGNSFTSTDISNDAMLSDKYVIQNGGISPGFPQGSILVVKRLSYLDSGTYTCSVEFTGGDNSGTTGSAEIQLMLLGNTEFCPWFCPAVKPREEECLTSYLTNKFDTYPPLQTLGETEPHYPEPSLLISCSIISI